MPSCMPLSTLLSALSIVAVKVIVFEFVPLFIKAFAMPFTVAIFILVP